MRTCVRVRCALARKNFIFIYSYYINVSCAVSYLVPLAVSLAVSLTNAKPRADGRLRVSLAVSLAVPLAVSCAVSQPRPRTCADSCYCEIERERVRPATGTNANVCSRGRPRTRTCAASGRPADGLRGACAEVAGGYGLRAPSDWAHGGGDGAADATAHSHAPRLADGFAGRPAALGDSKAEKGRGPTGRRTRRPPARPDAQQRKPPAVEGRGEHRTAEDTATNTGDQARRRTASEITAKRPRFSACPRPFPLKKRKNHGRGRACCCCVRAFFVYLPRI